jgi:hypothetical protein
MWHSKPAYRINATNRVYLQLSRQADRNGFINLRIPDFSYLKPTGDKNWEEDVTAKAKINIDVYGYLSCR